MHVLYLLLLLLLLFLCVCVCVVQYMCLSGSTDLVSICANKEIYNKILFLSALVRNSGKNNRL